MLTAGLCLFQGLQADAMIILDSWRAPRVCSEASADIHAMGPRVRKLLLTSTQWASSVASPHRRSKYWVTSPVLGAYRKTLWRPKVIRSLKNDLARPQRGHTLQSIGHKWSSRSSFDSQQSPISSPEKNQFTRATQKPCISTRHMF